MTEGCVHTRDNCISALHFFFVKTSNFFGCAWAFFSTFLRFEAENVLKMFLSYKLKMVIACVVCAVVSSARMGNAKGARWPREDVSSRGL